MLNENVPSASKKPAAQAKESSSITQFSYRFGDSGRYGFPEVDKAEQACSPGSVYDQRSETVISLRRALPLASSGLPGDDAGDVIVPLLGLALG